MTSYLKMGGSKILELYTLTALEARSLKSECQPDFLRGPRNKSIPYCYPLFFSTTYHA